MAVPTSLSTLNLSGKFTINKSLSHDMQEILALQGVGLIKRKALAHAPSPTINTKIYKDDAGIECLSVAQKISGMEPDEPDALVLDWTEKPKHTKLFGECINKAKRVKVDEITDAWLKEGWARDTLEHGCIMVHLAAKDGAWIMEQCLGIAEHNGERRYTRRISFTGPKGKHLQRCIYYDYLGDCEMSN